MKILDVGLAAVMMDRMRLYWIHKDLWRCIEFDVLPFLVYLCFLNIIKLWYDTIRAPEHLN